MSKKSRSGAQWKKNGSARYKTVAESNRKKRLERHLAKFPDDEQAKQALAKGDFSPRGGKKRVHGKKDKFERQVFQVKVDHPTIKGKKIMEDRVHFARVDKKYLRMKAEMKRINRDLSYQLRRASVKKKDK